MVAVGAGRRRRAWHRRLEHVLGTGLARGTRHRQDTGTAIATEANHAGRGRPSHSLTVPAFWLHPRLQCNAAGLTARDLVMVLLSGGASSLLPAPVPGVSLADKQQDHALAAGSPGRRFKKSNVVRKHLSRLKGGGLAASTQATIVTLVLSDVIGDDLGSIGSGPTAADPTTFADAIAVLKRYEIWRAVPASVRHLLRKAGEALVPETLKPGSRRLRHVQHTIIGNNRAMLAAVTWFGRSRGLRTVLLTTPLTGEARNAGGTDGRFARAQCASGTDILKRPCCVVAGGETTVTVTGRGKGGRAQEFAAAAHWRSPGCPMSGWRRLAPMGLTVRLKWPAQWSAETPSPGRRKSASISAAALARHNTYPALKALRCHIHTGPTGTNVNDLYLLLA